MTDELTGGPNRGAALRLELFVDDLHASLDFYQRVLGFELGGAGAADYVPLGQGSVHIALNLRSALPDGHPLRMTARERPGLGVEVVLHVDDVVAVRQHVVSQGWPLAAELKREPWGLTDFRVSDPDGYYWRVTSRREKGAEPC